jgi:hypothetical protein
MEQGFGVLLFKNNLAIERRSHLRPEGNTFLSPPKSIWTPLDSSGLYSKYIDYVFRKDYLWYASRVWVRVRVRWLG